MLRSKIIYRLWIYRLSELSSSLNVSRQSYWVHCVYCFRSRIRKMLCENLHMLPLSLFILIPVTFMITWVASYTVENAKMFVLRIWEGESVGWMRLWEQCLIQLQQIDVMIHQERRRFLKTKCRWRHDRSDRRTFFLRQSLNSSAEPFSRLVKL